MVALVFAMLGAMLLAWQAAVIDPAQLNRRTSAAADVFAANFWAYEEAASAYAATHPGTSGTIGDASLTFAPGYIRDPAWTNVVWGGTLYTYSTQALSPETKGAIAERGGRTLVIGIAQSDGTMTSFTGGAAGFALPASIPVGALVVIGD